MPDTEASATPAEESTKAAAPARLDDPDLRKRVFEAANEHLRVTGKPPTRQAVRDKVGADMNTVSALMREWDAERAKGVAAGTLADLPASTHAAVVQFWKTLEHEAAQQLRDARLGWETRRAEMQRELDRMTEEANTQAAEIKEYEKRVDGLTKEVQSLQSQVKELHEKAHQLELEKVELNGKAEAACKEALAWKAAHDKLAEQLSKHKKPD